MSEDFEVFKDDLYPPLVVAVTDDGVPIDLSTAASVTVIGRQNGVIKFSRAPNIVALGKVTMNLVSGDTDTIGPIIIQVKPIWPGAKPQTIEADNVMMVLRP